MNSDLFFDNKKYISTNQAGLLTGYSKDHIARLCAGDQVISKRIGRTWYVEEESIIKYKNSLIPNSLIKIENRYISINQARVLTGYSNGYIRRLCREGSVLSKRIGQSWFVEEESLIKYKNTPTSFDFSQNFQGKKSDEALTSSVLLLTAPKVPKKTAAYFSLLKAVGSFALALIITLALASTRSVDVPEVTKNLSYIPQGLYNSAQAIVVELSKEYTSVGESILSTIPKINSVVENPNSLLASLSTLDTSSLSIYNRINSFFNRFVYSPIAQIFESKSETIYVTNNIPTPSITTSESSTPQPPKQIATTNNTTIVNQPVIERVREVITTIPSDITRAELEKRLQELSNKFVSDIALQFSRLSSGTGSPITNIYQQIANSQKIDNLYNTAISNPTITGGSISNVTLGASSLSATNAGVGTLSVSGNSTFTGNVGIGSSTPGYKLSVLGDGYFDGGTVTTANLLATSSVTFSGISNSSLLALNGSGLLIATSTPTFGNFNATSTVATSTISTGGLSVGDSHFIIQQSSGRIAIATTTPQSQLEIFQSVNGLPILSAYRNTDLAPTGDFINYKTKAGTTLFRVDNSGNLLAGGIVTSGSQTITSVSTPQFRLQYDSSNEITFSTTNNGSTTIATNGSNSALNFTPQNDQVNAWNFTNALGTSILNIDSTNQRVGIASTTPGYKLSVAGSAYFDGGTVTASVFTATSSITTPSLTLTTPAINSLLSTDASGSIVATSTPTFGSFNATTTTATSTIAGFLDVLGTGTNATSTFSSNLWVKGTLQTGTGSMFLSDTGLTSSDGNLSIQRNATSYFNNGKVGIGTTTPGSRLVVVGSSAGAELEVLQLQNDSAASVANAVSQDFNF